MSELWKEVYRYGSAGLTEDVVDELLEIIEERDTRPAAPRFTAEEREAIAIALKLCEVGRLENYRINMMCDSKQIAMDNHKIASGAITTVRAMLTEADKGKG